MGPRHGEDERLRKSVEAIADDLTEDRFVLRYRTDETDDGLSGKEGSFLITSTGRHPGNFPQAFSPNASRLADEALAYGQRKEDDWRVSLDGPSRRVIVEPIEKPAVGTVKLPEPKPRPKRREPPRERQPAPR